MEQFVIIVRTLTTVSQRDKAGLLDPPLPGMTLLDIIFLSKGYWPFLLLDSVNELNSIKTFPLRESEFFWSVFSCIQTEYGEILCIFFFSIRVFFYRHWRLTGQQGKAGDHLLFHSTTSNRSRIFRHLFATLHVRRLSHIFNRIACIYHTSIRWDLPPYWIIIWLIDDVTLSFFVCLRDDWVLACMVRWLLYNRIVF